MTETETKLVDRLKEWYLAAADSSTNRSWRQRAPKCLRFYNGSGQWDESVKMLLESQGRPALTINRVLSTVNVIWGNTIQNRTEIRLEALNRGTKEIANLGSALIKHVMDCCQGYDASSDAFRDGLITGKGWLAADHVFDRDPLTGELIVEAPNPLTIYEDPRCTDYDTDQGEYVFRERFWTKNKLKAHFPGKYKDALAAMGNDWFQPISDETGNSLAGLIAFLNGMGGGSSPFNTDGAMGGVAVRECWWKEYESVRMATVDRDGQTIRAGQVLGSDGERELAQYMADQPGAVVTRSSTVVTSLHLAVMVGDLILRQKKNPLYGCKQFPYTRFTPYWLHGDSFGVVDNLVGPQEELNKSRSNLLHDANISGNPAWIADNVTPKGEQTIRDYGSSPGVLLNKKDFGGNIARDQPGGLSPAHRELSAMNAADIQEISGVNPNLMGTPTERVESGRARLIQQEAGLKVLAPIMGNFFRSQALLGERIWNLIRNIEVYSPEEIGAVVDSDIIEALGGLAGVAAAMKRWDAGVYAVKATMAKTSSTWTDVQLEEIKAVPQMLASMGLQMPPDVANSLMVEVLELLSFPGSSKVAEMLKTRPPMPIPPELPSGPGQKPKPAMAAAG